MDRFRAVRRVLWITMGLNLVATAAKLIVGYWTGSLSLVADGFEGDYEVAIVISNDSDLVEPIKVVRQKLGLPVEILNPQRDRHKTAWSLKNAADDYRVIRTRALASCQFPDIMQDAKGTFHKPAGW